MPIFKTPEADRSGFTLMWSCGNAATHEPVPLQQSSFFTARDILAYEGGPSDPRPSRLAVNDEEIFLVPEGQIDSVNHTYYLHVVVRHLEKPVGVGLGVSGGRSADNHASAPHAFQRLPPLWSH